MILDDDDMVTPQSEQQVRNAYAAAEWRDRYNRRARCPDPRNFDQQCRGAELALRMRPRAEQCAAERRRREQRQRELQAALDAGLVVPFPRPVAARPTRR